jgi:hypothetical protein
MLKVSKKGAKKALETNLSTFFIEIANKKLSVVLTVERTLVRFALHKRTKVRSTDLLKLSHKSRKIWWRMVGLNNFYAEEQLYKKTLLQRSVCVK